MLCKSAAGLINTPTDSQRNILQALYVWSQCMLCSTTPLSFLPRFPPTFGTFFLLPWEPPQFSQLLRPPTVRVDCSVELCQSALPSETYGPVQDAKKIRALPLFSALRLGQVNGPGDRTDSAGTEGRKLAGTYWGISFVGWEKIPREIDEVPPLWETTF